ncbi:MAG: GNAT family protein [Chloroflexi bacterium]|nr:GNAT family protein [Chloroflexota bacterium]
MPLAPLPPPLSAELLALRTTLPLKPADVTLRGQFVQLMPLVLERDLETLFAVSNGAPAALGERTVAAYDAEELIWRYLFAGPFANLAAFKTYVQSQVNAANGLCLCVVDQASGQPIGMTNFMNNSPDSLKIELGGIWYSPLVQRTPANTEATYLMLQHAFALGYQRLEWKCNALNERSRRAALRMGFQFEGIQESHMIVKDRNRDTAWFRILANEWPAVKTHLETLLSTR